jgi:hypothetical protein
MVTEEMLNLHLSTPPIQDEIKPFTLQIPRSKTKRRSENCVGDPLFATEPARRSPRRISPVMLSPLEEMDTTEDPPSPTPSSSRARSPPPLDTPSDSDDDEMDEVTAADERTKYLRRKKRTEQIAAYRMRELKYDRELRITKRNNPLSPKKERIGKLCVNV